MKERPTSKVYRVKNERTGRVYYGKANDPKARWSQHKGAAGHPLVAAMVQEGIENFSMEVLGEYSTEDEALDAELKCIMEAKKNGFPIYNRSTTRGAVKRSGKKGYTWCGKVWRDKGKNIWFSRWRYDDSSPWKTINVPNRIQDEGEAKKYVRSFVASKLEEKVLKDEIRSPLECLKDAPL